MIDTFLALKRLVNRYKPQLHFFDGDKGNGKEDESDEQEASIPV